MAFMVPLVKNHYDIYSRSATTDDHSLFHSQASLNQSKRSMFGSGKVVASGAGGCVRSNSSAATVGRNTRNSSTNGGNKKILIKITSRSAKDSAGGGTKTKTGSMVVATTTGRNGNSTGRLSSASISLPIRTENGKTVIALKPTTKLNIIKSSKKGGNSNAAVANNNANGSLISSSAAALVNSTTASNASMGATRPVPHVRRTVRNPYTNRVYSYSVSIPDYVAEEDEEDDIDDEDLESDLSKDEDLDDLMLYSSSAPPSANHLKRGQSARSREDEDDTFSTASSLLSAPPSLPPSPSKPGPHSSNNSTRCSTITINQSTINNFNHHKHSKSTTIDTGLSISDKSPDSQSPASSEPPTCTPNNAREGIELLRKFILQLKMLKLGGSARRMFNSNNGNSSSNNENAKPKSGRRSRKNTLEDSTHL